MGDIILFGISIDIPRINKQLDYTHKAMSGEDIVEVGVAKWAQGRRKVIKHGTHFLAHSNAHVFVIYNGLSKWPKLQCFDILGLQRKCKTVDYLLVSPSFLLIISPPWVDAMSFVLCVITCHWVSFDLLTPVKTVYTRQL